MWLFFASLLTTPPTTSEKYGSLAKGLLVVWIFSVFVLKQYIGGDMLSEMVKSRPTIVLDSWDDIIDKNCSIKALDPDVMERPELRKRFLDEYFPKNTIYHSVFTPYLEFFSLSMSRGKEFVQFIRDLTSKGMFGDYGEYLIIMAPKLALEYCFHNFIPEEIRIKFHTSEESGGLQPYFLMATHFAEKVERRNLNFV